ncbi:MAG TPA: YibE/F family protein [Nocardioides sp.]|nr:YibE/F family protein [Nocardioides sp.]
MGQGHGHGHGHRAARSVDASVRVDALPTWLLLGGLALALIGTIVGLAVWWPSHGVKVDQATAGKAGVLFAAPGVTFPHAEVVRVGKPCPTDGSAVPSDAKCGSLTVDLGGGQGTVDVTVPPEVSTSGLARGDKVELLRTPGGDGAPPTYAYFTTLRGGTLLWLALLFVLVVLAVARLRGLLALLGLAFGGGVVWWFLLPALYAGAPGAGVALVSAAAIMFVVLYTTHGVSLRTSAALAGTLLGIVLTAGIGAWAMSSAHLTGIADEGGSTLQTLSPSLDFRALLSAAVVIAGLGVLNDVTITQASAVWELRAATPDAPRRTLFTSAMRIGRDHIASTIYTIVFAYVGTAVIGLLLLQVYGLPMTRLLSHEQLAEEIVRTLASAIGLVLAVPVTTALAALLVSPGVRTPAGRRIAGMPVADHGDGSVQPS